MQCMLCFPSLCTQALYIIYAIYCSSPLSYWSDETLINLTFSKESVHFQVHLKSSDTEHFPSCLFFLSFVASGQMMSKSIGWADASVVSTFSTMVRHLPILIALSSVFCCALETFLFLHPSALLSKLSCPPFTFPFIRQLSSHVSFTSFELFFFFLSLSFVLISLSIWRLYKKGALVSRAESSGMTLL